MCRGRMYYRTIHDIAPGTELLVFYGVGYAKVLGIDVNAYRDRSLVDFLKPR